MDHIVLTALAKATLCQQPDGFDDGHSINREDLDGFEDPHELASQLLGIAASADLIGARFDHHYGFKFGFEFALQLGAAIARDPSRIPDISEVLRTSRSEVLEFVDVQLRRAASAARTPALA